jgi:FKBP-type peptidyl-prolyl cis-trans isomerase FklB
MNLKLAMRWMMMTVAGALLLGTAIAQQPPAADKPQKEAPAVSKEQQGAPAVRSEPEPATPGKSQPEPTIQSRKDKISYAYGVDIIRDIQRQKNNLNVDLLMRAMNDAFAGNKLIMTDEEVVATLKTFEAEQKKDFEHARTMVSERNRRQGEAFFAENAKKEGVVTLPSGLQYKILKTGDGKLPTLEDTVLCNYRGTLLDGTEIDSSYKRKEPTAVPVKGVLAGWTQALQMMPVGSKWQLFIPPQLAYGDRPTPTFGPNSTLIFEVELLLIQDKPQTVGAVEGKPGTAAKVR